MYACGFVCMLHYLAFSLLFVFHAENTTSVLDELGHGGLNGLDTMCVGECLCVCVRVCVCVCVCVCVLFIVFV
jgi:hypothetical protein